MSERGTRWMRERSAHFAETRHPDGTPRYTFLQRIKRFYESRGWPFVHPDAHGMRRLLDRAQGLDALERNNPPQYRHVMRMRVDRAVAMDRATDAAVGRTRDCDHCAGGCITTKTRKESNMHRRNDYETRMHRALDALLDRFERRKGARAAARATDEANRNGDLEAAYERRRQAGGQFFKEGR